MNVSLLFNYFHEKKKVVNATIKTIVKRINVISSVIKDRVC